MKTTGSCCVVLYFALTFASAVQNKLDSITDLKKLNYGQTVPKHSLMLLHWFANTVDIDNNDNIWLTFDPNVGDYGSHHYGNYEGLLEPLPRGNGYRYYTIGNLNQETSVPLPPYVVHPPRQYVGRNRDRVIIRVRVQNTGWRDLQRIDQVYITQHYDTSEHQGTPYDPDHTYQIATNLLRQIREFSVGENQQPLWYLRRRFGSNADDLDIRNTWGDLASLGLLLFIVIQEKFSANQHNNGHGNRRNLRANDASTNRNNVPRGFPNPVDFVVDLEDYEVPETSEATGNRESDSDNIPVPRCKTRMSFCCICCTVTVCLVLLCIMAVFLYKRISNN
ncbi:uncharacterized protein LOC131982923 [Centropristis striata]|uniref:uncharacterized protein LOC131982923 n=1 Tax=Centropristis striata TaxID=184440 RepID=UPI0027DF9E1F|nr:uncharacterized protein LOC131982923 [Centropristis striata]